MNKTKKIYVVDNGGQWTHRIWRVVGDLGYQTKIIHLLTIIDNPSRKGEDRQNIAFIFILGPIKKTGEHDDEVENIYWFNLEKLPVESEFAFDHYQIIELYKKYLREKFPLPRF